MASDSLSRTFLAAAFLMFAAKAETEFFIVTETFGDYKHHEIPQLNEAATAGLAIGWAFFSIVVIVATIMVFKDIIGRHYEYIANLEKARIRMRELGISVEDADAEFTKKQKSIKEVEGEAETDDRKV